MQSCAMIIADAIGLRDCLAVSIGTFDANRIKGIHNGLSVIAACGIIQGGSKSVGSAEESQEKRQEDRGEFFEHTRTFFL